MTTTTAITCPQHPDCVAKLITRPGRSKLPMGWLADWLDAKGAELIEVSHHESKKNPDVMLANSLHGERTAMVKDLSVQVQALSENFDSLASILGEVFGRLDAIENRKRRWFA